MANRIEELVKKSGKKLTEISQETNIPYPTLSGYHQGTRNPKAENARVLSAYFGVSIPYLLGLDEEKVLFNPGKESIAQVIHRFLKNKTSISKQIDEWTPFKDDVALILADFRDTQLLESYIDFVAQQKGYNPVVLKAFKQSILDYDTFPYLMNKSGDEQSPYHYVWEAWINSDEYKEKLKNKDKK